MSQISGGEFVKSFFGPSPAGDYTVSSFFSCGNKNVHNAGGTFTVTAPEDTGGDDDDSGSGSSSGSGGGGGGGGGSGGKSAQILGFEFEPALSKNASSVFRATVQNLTSQIKDYLLEYTILHPTGEVTMGEKTILAVAPYQPTTIVVDNGFTPLYTGVYTITGTLRSLTRTALYDTESLTIDVQGEHLLATTLESPSTSTASGLTFPFSLALHNGGDFKEENIQVHWALLDPEGGEYFMSSFTANIDVGETTSYSFAPFIPLDALLGSHELVVQVTSSGIMQEKRIRFDVVSPNEYYAQFISDMEVRIDQLENKVAELQGKGFDVDAESLVLLDIQQELADAKGMLLSGNFAGLNTQLLELSEKITRLGAILDNIERQAPLLSREGLTLILYIGAGLLAAVFLWFLFFRRKKKEEPRSSPIRPSFPGLLDRLLGIQRTYYPLLERKEVKHKPLISDLLGLKERN